MYRHFLRYNARICAGLGPWMLVVPVASTMLVLFALMAMTSLVKDHTPVLVLEYLGALVMAFVGTTLLRPEYQYRTLETVLTRPVSFRAIVTVRMGLAAAGVLVVQALMAWFMLTVMDKEYEVGLALLSMGASMVFLTALGVMVATLWRSPILGFIVAGAFWALDVVFGGQLNPLVALAGYARSIDELEGAFEFWWAGKIAMLVVAAGFGAIAARAGARPAGQWSLRRIAHAAVGIGVAVIIYLGSGAAYKVHWATSREDVLGNRSRLAYQQAFKCYGPLPVAHVFGLSLPRFIGYRAPWTKLVSDPDGAATDTRYYEQEQLKLVAFGSPNGRFADNALYELGRTMTTDEEGPTDRHQIGINCLEQLLSDHPDSPFAALGAAKLWHARRVAGDEEAAQETLISLLTTYASSQAAVKTGKSRVYELRDAFKEAERVHREEGGPPPDADLLREAVEIGEMVAAGAEGYDLATVKTELGDLYGAPEIGQTESAASAYGDARRLADEIIAELSQIEDKEADQVNRLRDAGALRAHATERIAILRGETPPPQPSREAPPPTPTGAPPRDAGPGRGP